MIIMIIIIIIIISIIILQRCQKKMERTIFASNGLDQYKSKCMHESLT